ncbi:MULTISPECIES: DUF1178 family protein [Methylobacterium]|jgi:hypothetical protein|uniref:DUF1178 family protein n=1 Tax=Methylobacterium hispanicum TaxID=270350 RepID=A0AAV4ZS81_9HYPH|nr:MULTISPECIES: DUF1178 family protein [Methylobacterium]MBE7196307.1 DUF1178 family protein [Parafilimonas terrae]GJD91133.1 hypothetical protein BHAOGJBA_4681 [Methylobacterium hispanicum]
MIRYALVCEAGHEFESWFPSSDSYDDQAARGLVACPVCDSTKVGKALMAPRLARTDQATAPVPAPAEDARVPMISEPERQVRAMLRAFRAHVVANSEAVGPRFAEEARKIHYGESEERSIHGQASPEEARALIEEGISVAALPIVPDDRN